MYLIKQRIRAHLFVNFALYKYLIIIIIIIIIILNLPSRPLKEKVSLILRYQFESRTIRFLKGIVHSSNYMVKQVLITSCGMQILQLDTILQ